MERAWRRDAVRERRVQGGERRDERGEGGERREESGLPVPRTAKNAEYFGYIADT